LRVPRELFQKFLWLGSGQSPDNTGIIMQKHKVGLAGEDTAAKYLERSGFKVIERRCHAGHLETDIIAVNDEYILFTEVKARRAIPGGTHPYGTPGSAVDAKKSANLIAAAEEYLRTHKEETKDLQPRIDVIEVYFDPREEGMCLLHLNHIKNAVRRRGR